MSVETVTMAREYRNNYGKDDSHRAWYTPGDPGLFYPHSSNNALTQNAPLECEVLWEDCIRNMRANRHLEWKELDDPNNPDNSTNDDLLDENYSDPDFERVKNVIRLQLAYHHKVRKFKQGKDVPSRFLNKNPMNGFRIGYLHQLFPDAKFVHLSRNPLKTCESQIQLEDCAGRCWYFDPQEFRKHAFAPKPLSKEVIDRHEQPPKHWSWLLHGNYPNQFLGFHWFPRIFPRTTPEYHQINKYLKKDKRACAFATGIVQQERCALEAYERLGFKEGKKLLSLWHEDLLHDPALVLERIFEFLEVDTTKDQIMEFLRKEDFPQGKPNVARVERSNEKQEKVFGDETEEVMKALEPCLKRFKERVPFSDKIKKQIQK
ncbi:hypothetical protein RFI_19855 [Reticulomyxa filosa]|uniref:Protein-tyrosine sulfotransferase n=1 Tax=Reticulomyxa filosa TaxID=46433 RepID=X6MWK8_RETFI|nr:hypothetical protein RFI_19855 [Reticulomyxa filosa]|eukprot:ETO17465.1 hypothetical protein RFI_19855 [Reticulomyxa filosa]